MIHSQNLASLQQGNQTTTNYMPNVKHNIEFLALMNVLINFDELSIRVLNELGLTYSNRSHALQVQEIPVMFEELFEHLLNYEAQLQLLVPSALLANTPATALVTLVGPSSHRRSHNYGGKSHN